MTSKKRWVQYKIYELYYKDRFREIVIKKNNYLKKAFKKELDSLIKMKLFDPKVKATRSRVPNKSIIPIN